MENNIKRSRGDTSSDGCRGRRENPATRRASPREPRDLVRAFAPPPVDADDAKPPAGRDPAPGPLQGPPRLQSGSAKRAANGAFKPIKTGRGPFVQLSFSVSQQGAGRVSRPPRYFGSRQKDPPSDENARLPRPV